MKAAKNMDINMDINKYKDSNVRKSPYSHIIWDWNGTLLDDVVLCYNTINNMLKKRSLREINGIEAYRDIFCFPVIEYYRKAGFDFNKESFEDLAVEFIFQYHDKDLSSCTLHDNAINVINEIHKNGLKQVILSASKKSNLMNQIEHYGIINYFDEILGISDIYAGSKIDIGMDYISKAIIKKAVLIGDTIHDYETAMKLSADCILIANGHQSRKRLSETTKALDISEIKSTTNYQTIPKVVVINDIKDVITYLFDTTIT